MHWFRGEARTPFSFNVLTKRAPFLLLPLLVAQNAFSDDAAKAEFLRAYPAAAQKLEDFYSGCRMTATLVDYKRNSQTRHTFGRNGSELVVQLFDHNAESGLESEKVWLINNIGAFSLRRFPRTDTYVLSSTIPTDAAMEAARAEFLPAFAPFCIGRERLVDFMKLPEFRITGVEKNGADDDRLKISWQCPYVEEGVGPVNRWGILVVSPADGWAIHERDWSLGSSEMPFVRSNRVSVRYGDKLDGMPVVIGVTRWTETGEDRKRSGEQSFENVTFRLESIPARNFTLAAFGIEQHEPKSTSHWPLYSTIAALLVVFAILGLFICRSAYARR